MTKPWFIALLAAVATVTLLWCWFGKQDAAIERAYPAVQAAHDAPVCGPGREWYDGWQVITASWFADSTGDCDNRLDPDGLHFACRDRSVKWATFAANGIMAYMPRLDFGPSAERAARGITHDLSRGAAELFGFRQQGLMQMAVKHTKEE